MKRLIRAPNLALATLWADLLTHAGVPTTVQRAYASSIAGEVPPDQTLPELWVTDETQWEGAGRLLDELRNPPHRHWASSVTQSSGRVWSGGTSPAMLLA